MSACDCCSGLCNLYIELQGKYGTASEWGSGDGTTWTPPSATYAELLDDAIADANAETEWYAPPSVGSGFGSITTAGENLFEYNGTPDQIQIRWVDVWILRYRLRGFSTTCHASATPRLITQDLHGGPEPYNVDLARIVGTFPTNSFGECYHEVNPYSPGPDCSGPGLSSPADCTLVLSSWQTFEPDTIPTIGEPDGDIKSGTITYQMTMHEETCIEPES